MMNKTNGQVGIITGALLCLLLLYIPWGYILHTGIAVPEHAGWILFGLGFMAMAVHVRLAFYRAYLLLAGMLLLTLPLLWISADADIWRALTRVLALWTGGVLFFWLAARPLTAMQAEVTGRMIVVVGALCALTVLLRVFWPVGYTLWLPLAGTGWAAGGVIQPDLMATFLATALAVGLQAWLMRGRTLMLLVLFVLMFALALCQSLVGLAGIAVVAVMMLLLCARGLRRRLWGALLVLMAGGLTGGLVLTRLLHIPVIHPVDGALMVTVFRACFALLANHPFIGVGYGAFEGALPSGVLLAGAADLFHPHVVVAHPGNELLYWITEGGLVVLIGMVLLLAWGCRLVFGLYRQASRVGGYGHEGSDGLGWVLCALPVFLFCMVGFPWYGSPMHYLLFVVFIGMATARQAEPMKQYEPGRGVARSVRAVMLLAGVAVVWFALSGVWVAMGVQDARQTMARDVHTLVSAHQLNPWYLSDEVGFALTVNQLQQFSQTHDAALLPPAEVFLKAYLTRHPDPNVYSMLITVLDKQSNVQEAEAVYREGQRQVFWDNRFASEPAAVVSPQH
ncbi:O-antigen ligase family protein [Yersinia enterocolitica]